jgi:hypothetical protein
MSRGIGGLTAYEGETSVVSLKLADIVASIRQIGRVANSNKTQVLRLRCAPLRMTHLCCEL